MAGPVDPDRIDVSLDLVGEGSLAAVEQLAEQLSRITEHLSQFERGTSGSSQVQSNLAGRFRTGTGVFEGGPSGGASVAVGIPLANSAGLAASVPDESLFQRARRYSTMRPGQAVQAEVDHYGQRERSQHARRALNGMPDYDLSGVGGTGGGYGYNFGNSYLGSYVDGGNYGGGTSAGASMPPNPLQPGWRNALTANPAAWEQAQEGVRLPPGGLSMNIQDKLRLASNALAGSAERSMQRTVASDYAPGLAEAQSMGWTEEEFNRGINDNDYSGEGLKRGNAATLLRSASESNLLVGMQAVGHDVSRLGGRAYAYGGGLQQAGVEAGDGRAGQINIPGTDIGITNPFALLKGGGAAREGINQRMNVQRLRMMGGINKDQANAIVGSLAGAGWTGEEGQNMAFDAIAPLVQQGLNPEVTSNMLDQAYRSGNTSLKDFRDTLKDLGSSAKAARMSLTEYQESLDGFANWAQGNGTTYTKGLQLGRSVSTSLGMAPQVAQSLMESPLAQAGAMSQGLLPNELSLQSGSMATGSIFSALNLAEKATANFPALKDASGKVTVDARDRQDAQIASMLQTTPDIVKKLRRQRDASPAASTALKTIDQYSSTASTINSTIKPITGVAKKGDWIEVDEFTGQTYMQGTSKDKSKVKQVNGKYYVNDDDLTSNSSAIAYGEKVNKLNPAALTAAHDLQQGGGSSWTTVEKDLTKFQHAGGLDRDKSFTSRMQKIETMDPTKRGAAAKDLINDYMRKVGGEAKDPSKPTVYVEFTGKAKELFKQTNTDAKDAASRGGDPISNYATGPSAPRTTMQDFLNGG